MQASNALYLKALHDMSFREQIYSRFESMDCLTQVMKENADYQRKIKFGSGKVNCSQIRIIPALKTWNFVQNGRVKFQGVKNEQTWIFRQRTQQIGSHHEEQEQTIGMSFCGKKDISSGKALYLKAKFNGKSIVMIPKLTCALNTINFKY